MHESVNYTTLTIKSRNDPVKKPAILVLVFTPHCECHQIGKLHDTRGVRIDEKWHLS